MNYEILQKTIMNIQNTLKSAENIPLSIIVVSDRDWLHGGCSARFPFLQTCFSDANLT